MRRLLPALLAPFAALALACAGSAVAHSIPATRTAHVHRGEILHQHPFREARQDGREARVRMRRVRLARASQPSGLPDTWCGARETHDLTDPPGQSRRPVIKVIYAYPADMGGRFDYLADLLQSDASQMDRFVAAQSEQRKTLRFDMGSTCGPQYLDIEILPLRHDRDDYLYEDPSRPGVRYPFAGQAELYDEIQAAIAGQTPSTTNYRAPVRNFLVFVDGLNTRLDRNPDGSWRASPQNWDWGSATTYADDSPDPYAQRNINPYGQIATMFGSAPESEPGGHPVSDPSQGFMPSEQLHEVFHTLGAVQPDAPDATPWFHCTDGADIMCYQDSSDPRSAQRSVCPPISDGLFTQSLDCDDEDYFNPSPLPGSFLASHWNTFDSPFLGSCRELLQACGWIDASTEADQATFDVDRANGIWSRTYGSPAAGSGIRVRIPRRQPVARHRGILAWVHCRGACAVAVGAGLALRGEDRSWQLRRQRLRLTPGTTEKLKLRLRGARRQLRRDIAVRNQPWLRVGLTVRSATGGRHVQRRVRALTG